MRDKVLTTPPQKILIVLIAGIGDLILASKSIRAIRNGYPCADIHLVTSTEASSIARNYPYIDKVYTFPIRELRRDKSYILNILKLLGELRKEKYSHIVNLYNICSFLGAIKMGLFFKCIKSEMKIGHDYKGFGLFINKKIPKETFSNKNFADAMLDIAISMGGKPDYKGIEIFFCEEEGKKKWGYIFSSEDNKSIIRTIGINPGGDRSNRRWNPDNYATLADWFVENLSSQVILLGGPGEENISREIEGKTKSRIINLGGKLTLDELAYIISQLDLLVTNDSGPMHIAAAVKTPIVAIFGPEDPALMGPYTSKELYKIIHKKVDCRPCKKEDCTNPICLENIKPEEVFETCKEILLSRGK